MGEGLALLLPAVARWILIAVDWNLTIIRWIAHLLAGQSWAASWSPDWPWPWIIGYYVVTKATKNKKHFPCFSSWWNFYIIILYIFITPYAHIATSLWKFEV